MADGLGVGTGSHAYLKNTKDENIQKSFTISGGIELRKGDLYFLFGQVKKTDMNT